MKKILLIFSSVIMFFLVGCSLSNGQIDNLKTSDTKKIQDTRIDANYVTCYITPNGFDYEKLQKNYSRMSIDLTYYVTYEKTWTGWDFLYAGSPKYDIKIKNEDNIGVEKVGLPTTSRKEKHTLNYTSDLVNLVNNRIILEIGSINVQNCVIFTDIVVNYSCL